MRKKYLLITSPTRGVLKAQSGTSLGYTPGFNGYNGKQSFSAGTGFSGYDTQTNTAPSSIDTSAATGAGVAGAGLITSVGSNALGSSAEDDMRHAYTMDDLGLMDPNEKNLVQAQTKQGMAKGASIGGSAGSIAAGAGLGATIGSFIPIPGLGTAAGAAIGAGIAALAGTAVGGAIGSLFGRHKGKKNYEAEQEEYDKKRAELEKQNEIRRRAGVRQDIRQADIARSNSLIARKGVKMDVPTFKAGGKLETPGTVNVVAKGKLHRENNNLGNKDKGIPVVDSNGVKRYEIEKEELVLRQEATTKFEDLVKDFNSTQAEDTLLTLGKEAAKEFLTNTQDNSGKFKVKV